MKRPRFIWRIVGNIALALLGVALSESQGQAVALSPAPPRGAGYLKIKTWHEHALEQSGLTKAQRLDLLKEVVRNQYGNDTLQGPLFKNLKGIDPTIPGMEKNARLMASDNLQKRKGAVRTTLYARKISLDQRYKVLAVDEPQYGADGKMETDKDIRFRHAPSGVTGRIEVKEVSVNTQRANLAKYKTQIDKMAAEYRRTGEMQVYVNRKEVIPELKQYAKQKGVRVYDRVATGEKTGQIAGNTRIEDVMNDVHKQAVTAGRVRAFIGGAQAAFGVILLAQALPAAYEDVLLLADPLTRTVGGWLRFGEHGSLVVAGSSMTSAGAAILARQFATQTATLSRLATISRWGGRLGIIAFVASEGFIIAQYWTGDLTPREFWTTQAQMGGGLVGGLAGAAIGVWIGGPVGAVVGFVAGVGLGYGGSTLAGWGVKSWYESMDAEQQRKYEAFLYDHYGVRN